MFHCEDKWFTNQNVAIWRLFCCPHFMKNNNYKTSKRGQAIFFIDLLLFVVLHKTPYGLYNWEITGLDYHGRFTRNNHLDIGVVLIILILSFVLSKLEVFKESKGDAVSIAILLTIVFGVLVSFVKTQVLL